MELFQQNSLKNMPKHLAIGKNIISGTATFNNVKTVLINLGTAFTKKPIITITLENTSTVPAYKVVISNNKFEIRFQNNFTGSVEWCAIERQ